jgi:hypothetical protein
MAHAARIAFRGTKLPSTQLKALLASSRIPKLTHLDLSGADIGHPGLKELAKSDAIPALEHLALDANSDHDKTKWDDRAIEALTSTRGGALAALRSLSIEGWDFHHAKAFGQTDLARQLVSLSLAYQMTIGWRTHAFLDGLGPGAKLESLDLSYCYRNYLDGLEDWNSYRGNTIEKIPSLKKLVFRESSFEMQPIIDAWWWPLETLVLGDASPASLAPLEQAKPGLLHLDLRDSAALRVDHLRTWSAWPVFEHLETLVITGRTDLRTRDVATLPEAMQRAIAKGGFPD